MPTPSASRTARDLSTRPTSPRWHSTIASATSPGVEAAGCADPGVVAAWRRPRAPAAPSTSRAGPTARVETIAPSSRGPPLAHDPAQAGPAGGAADGGDPRAGVGGVRRAAGVAGRGDDDDVGLGGAEQRALDRVDLGGPAHGEAEHVDPVAGGAVDRGDQVGGGAAVVGGVGGSPARLVDRDPGLRRHPARSGPALARPPAPGRRRCRRRSRPSGCRGRRSRAADRYGRGCAGCPRRSPSTNHRAPTTLSSQSSASQPSPAGQAPEKPAGLLAERGRGGEQRALRREAGVDHADDGAGAAPARPLEADRRPSRRSRAGHRADLVGLDQGHVVGALELQRLLRR